MNPAPLIPRIALLSLAPGLIGLALVTAVSADIHPPFCNLVVTAEDIDGDGLTDEVEKSGFSVTIFAVDGTESKDTVFPDINNPDTDGDGLCDGDEVDPRETFFPGGQPGNVTFKGFESFLKALEVSHKDSLVSNGRNVFLTLPPHPAHG